VTVYVDDWRQPARIGPVTASWSHLLADDHEELHRLADRLGLRRAWFQEHRRHRALNHYDVTEDTRHRAIALGAVPITWREAGRMIRRWRLADGPGGPPAAAEAVGRRHDEPGAGDGGHGHHGDDRDRRAVSGPGRRGDGPTTARPGPRGVLQWPDTGPRGTR